MLGEELDGCNLKLMELDEAVQKFSKQNDQLGKPLAKKIGKLSELHQQTIKQAENRLSKLSQVRCPGQRSRRSEAESLSPVFLLKISRQIILTRMMVRVACFTLHLCS